MSLSKNPAGGMLYKGAVFGAGLLGVLLWRKAVLPKYMGLISIGAASFGLYTVIRHILKGKKRSNIDFRQIDSFYEDIASQVNEELSQQGIRRREFAVERYTVDETEDFSPVSCLRSGMELSEIYSKLKEASNQGNFLKTYAERFRLKEVSETKVDKSVSVDPLELPLSEDEDELSKSEMEVKKKRGIVLNLSKSELNLLRDAISESKGQSSQDISKLFNEWETVYPKVEKEISDIRRPEKGLRLRKILGLGKSGKK